MSGNDTKFLIKVENRQPVGHPIQYSNFLLLFPMCPIQETPTNDVVGPYGYEVFERAQQPTVGVFEHPPIRQDIYVCGQDGIWRDTWQIIPFTQEEITARTEMEWETVKRLRFLRLLTTDWTQLATISITQEELTNWNIYRQALRDVPQNTVDPFNVTWPIIPYPEKIPYGPRP